MSAIQLSRCEHDIHAEAAEFSGSSFSEVSLQQSSFDLVTFSGATFSKVAFDGCRFDEVRFDNARMERVSFKDVRLSEQNLTGLTIEGIPASDLLRAWRAANPT